MAHGFGLLGIVAILAVAVLFSTDRRQIRLSIVARAFALQALVAVLVLYVPAGKRVIAAMSGGVQAILSYADAGIDMVFGPAAHPATGVIFAFQVLPIIIFFSALMGVLYHLRIMQIVVAALGGLLQRAIGTRPVESLNAAATAFVGQTESPLVIRPYLARLTDPQLFAVMVSGFASVAGSVLAAYAKMGINIDYLLAASFMAAPGGLLMAKLLMPDGPTPPEPPGEIVRAGADRHASVIMAAAVGAQDGLKIAVSCGAMLVAFVGLIALMNGLLGLVAGPLGAPGLTFQTLLGQLFAPIMYLLDIPWREARAAGAFFGEKLILNEFIAFLHLGEAKGLLSPRTEAIVTFSLCGFANFSSIAIQMGCLGALLPSKLGTIARFGLRGVLAGSLANLMSAALAGLLLPG